MCQLIYNEIEESAEGWKVVLKLGTKFYSPATGLCYDNYKNKPLPKIRKIKLLDKNSSYFTYEILRKESQYYHANLVGRTCIFKSLMAATKLAKRVRSHWIYHNLKGDILLMKAVVSKDLMSGKYGQAYVVAGKQISLHEIIDLPNGALS